MPTSSMNAQSDMTLRSKKPDSPLQPTFPLELVFMICKEIRYNGPEWRQDLAYIAHSCKAYSNIALDDLWKDMTDIKPLLNLIPGLKMTPKSRRSARSYHFESIPRGADWALFNKYSSRVRCLKYTHEGDFDYEVINDVARYRGDEPLLPNLSVLQWRHRMKEEITGKLGTAISAFLTPSIRHLSVLGYFFPFFADSAGGVDPILASFFDALPEKVPNLQRLVLDGNITEVPLKCLSRFQHLTELDIDVYAFEPVFTADVLDALTSLDTLTSLRLIGVGIFGDQVGLWNAFPRLQKIALKHTRVIDATAIVSRLSSTSLADFFVDDNVEDMLVEDVRNLGMALSRFTSTLTSIHIQVANVVIRHHGSDALSGSDVLINGVEPLFELRELNHFNLTTLAWDQKWRQEGEVSTLVLTDEDVERMSLAWPKLVFITLIVPTSPISVQSLISLAQHCPDLQVLHLFEINVPGNLDLELAAISDISNGLCNISFRRHTIPYERKFAKFLDSLFPRLKSIRGYMHAGIAEYLAEYQNDRRLKTGETYEYVDDAESDSELSNDEDRLGEYSETDSESGYVCQNCHHPLDRGAQSDDDDDDDDDDEDEEDMMILLN